MPLGFYVRVLDHKWLLFPDSTVHTVAALTAQATRDAHAQGFLAPNQSLASLQLCLNGSDFVVLSPTSEVSLLVAHCTEEKGAGHDVVLVGQVTHHLGEAPPSVLPKPPGARASLGAARGTGDGGAAGPQAQQDLGALLLAPKATTPSGRGRGRGRGRVGRPPGRGRTPARGRSRGRARGRGRARAAADDSPEGTADITGEAPDGMDDDAAIERRGDGEEEEDESDEDEDEPWTRDARKGRGRGRARGRPPGRGRGVGRPPGRASARSGGRRGRPPGRGRGRGRGRSRAAPPADAEPGDGDQAGAAAEAHQPTDGAAPMEVAAAVQA